MTTLPVRIERLERRLAPAPWTKLRGNAANGIAFDYAAFAAAFEPYTAGLPPDELAGWARRMQDGVAAVERARGERP